jgi:tRNA (guanine-N7-)-methyltransferase
MGTEQPIELEVGPGLGGFILERLLYDPDVVIVGLEIRRKLATVVDRKIAALGLSGRGRVFAEDVKPALARFQPGTVRRIYVHFPDPWWKKRHHKRLVVSTEFATLAANVLLPGGDLFVQTDVPDRADAYEEVLSNHPAFESWAPHGARVDDAEFGARSPRERRAMRDGLPITRLRFRRVEGSRRAEGDVAALSFEQD